MLSYGDVLEQGRQAFADGDGLLAYHLLMAGLYLAFGQGRTRGVRAALQHALDQDVALIAQGAHYATKAMVRAARSRAEFLLRELERAERAATALPGLAVVPRPSLPSQLWVREPATPA